MKYLCCYVDQPDKRTAKALKRLVPDSTVYVEIDKDDPFAYAATLNRHWQQGEDFAVIEQDIVIRKDVVTTFHACPSLYCAFPYAWTTNVGPALGCTRFRAEFLARYPGAMQEVVNRHVHWRQVDVVLMRHVLARSYGEQPCVHLPPVEHLNEAKRLLPDADPTPMLSVPVDDIGAVYRP